MTLLSKQPLKITVVTAAFNAIRTLGRCIESVSRQTYPHVEHILIDGGSKDGTIEFIERLKKPLAEVVSEPDDGIYDAMNKGLALATGDIVAFLNADDFYAKTDTLARVAYSFENSNLDILTGNVAFFHPENEEKIVRIYNSRGFEAGLLARGIMPAHPALFVKREILQIAGGFKSDYKIAGDFELVARIFTRQNPVVGHLPEVLVKMQYGGISTSGLKARWVINQEIMRACKENGIKTNMLKLWTRYINKIAEFRYFRLD